MSHEHKIQTRLIETYDWLYYIIYKICIPLNSNVLNEILIFLLSILASRVSFPSSKLNLYDNCVGDSNNMKLKKSCKNVEISIVISIKIRASNWSNWL